MEYCVKSNGLCENEFECEHCGYCFVEDSAYVALKEDLNKSILSIICGYEDLKSKMEYSGLSRNYESGFADADVDNVNEYFTRLVSVLGAIEEYIDSIVKGVSDLKVLMQEKNVANIINIEDDRYFAFLDSLKNNGVVEDDISSKNNENEDEKVAVQTNNEDVSTTLL